MNTFNNIQKHLTQHHPGYALQQLDNGVALMHNNETIGVATTPLEAHKLLVTVTSDDLLKLPIVNDYGSRERTGTTVPLEVYDYVTNMANELGVHRNELVVEVLQAYWPLKKVRLRAERMRRGLQGLVLDRKSLAVTFVGGARDVVERIPRGLLASAIIACFEEERGEEWIW